MKNVMKNKKLYLNGITKKIFRFRKTASGTAVSISVLAILLYLFVFQSQPVVTETTGWEESYSVLSAGGDLAGYNIAAEGNYVAVVYETKQRGVVHLNAAVSFDKGKSFISDIKIAETDSSIEAVPAIALNSRGGVAVVWQQFNEEDASTELFQSRSGDLGANWSPPVKISPDSRDDLIMKMLPDIFYDDRDRLHLFFHGLADDKINLYHAVSEDGDDYGRADTLMRLPDRMRGAFFPVISVSGSNISIVWQSKTADFVDSLFLITSSNYGRSWSRISEVTSDDSGDSSPHLFLHNDKSYLVYRNNRENHWAINLLVGDSGGSTWNEPVVVSDTRSNCFAPRVAMFENDLIISWYDMREGEPHIFLRKYSLSEKSLSPSVRISGRPASRDPVPIAFEDRVLIFWQESRRILARKSDTQAVPPVVRSSTHPEESWSRNSQAVIEWNQPRDPSGIVGYAVMYNNIPDYNPTIRVLEGNARRFIVPDIEEGVSYFHIRSIDGANNMSRTVHYKIKSSTTPLPMPSVVSPTHPEGEAVDRNDPLLRWAVDHTERLKGFYIGVSRDRAVRPDEFTTDFELELENLQPGNYYLSISAVDMTNTPGNTSVYHFVVGSDVEVDEEYAQRIAENYEELSPPRRPLRQQAAPRAPMVSLNLEGVTEKTIKNRSFTALASVENLKKDDLIGYSVVIDRNRLEPLKRINYKNDKLKFDNLESGDYYISIRAKYKSRGIEQWTETSYYNITVELMTFETPLFEFSSAVISGISEKPYFVMLYFSLMAAFVIANNFGERMKYYFKYFSFLIRKRD